MEKSKLIERVRKLYAMSQDTSSPNEAAIAAKRARAMMDQHGITVADLETSEYLSALASEHGFKALPSWYGYLVLGICEANDCVAKREGGQVFFQGFDQDVISSQLMLEYLIKAMERQLKIYKKESGDTSRKASGAFKSGFCSDMKKRLEEIKKERQIAEAGTGLMVIKTKLVRQKFGATKTSSHRAHCGDRDARDAGRAASQRTGLNTQVSRPTAQAAIS